MSELHTIIHKDKQLPPWAKNIKDALLRNRQKDARFIFIAKRSDKNTPDIIISDCDSASDLKTEILKCAIDILKAELGRSKAADAVKKE